MGMGFVLGLVSSATFGLIPLFSLPLLHAGFSAATTLFYRFAIAALSLGIILALRHERFALRGIDVCKLAGLSSMYMLAALLLFWAFSHLPSGVAATLQFLYPVMVMLIMVGFFGERFVCTTFLAILLSIAGVGMLSSGGGAEGKALNWLGVGMMLLSALCNALYIVGLQIARIPNASGLMLTFYVMLCSALLSLANALGSGSFQLLTRPQDMGMAVLLALITAVISNWTLILAIQHIGSTLASVLGVLEPLTAVLVGILVFGEPFSPALAGGVSLIIAAVLLVMLGRQISTLWTRLRTGLTVFRTPSR